MCRLFLLAERVESAFRLLCALPLRAQDISALTDDAADDEGVVTKNVEFEVVFDVVDIHDDDGAFPAASPFFFAGLARRGSQVSANSLRRAFERSFANSPLSDAMNRPWREKEKTLGRSKKRASSR